MILPKANGFDVSIAIGLFLLATAVRLPPCFESLWLDELHTAWTLAGPFTEVASRAAAGNQSPLYFWACWLLQYLPLPLSTELELRLPAVLATAGAAALLYASLRQLQVDRCVAVIMGSCFALHSHLVFFGTEARVFGLVILLSCLGCHWFMSERPARWIIACGLLAIAIQPVSAIWFGLLGVAACARPSSCAGLPGTDRAWPWRSLLCLLLLGLLTLAITRGALGQAWTHRAQWSSFGSAQSLWQLWAAFPWLSLLVIPIVVYLTSLIAGRWLAPHANRTESYSEATHSETAMAITKRSVWLVMLSLVTVLIYWTVAWFEIAPIFHRRYFIAALPPLFWFAGSTIDRAYRMWLDRSRFDLFRWLLGVLTAAAPLLAMIAGECQLQRAIVHHTLLVQRNEGWREAVQWLGQRHPASTVVYLDAGLIESKRLLASDQLQMPRSPLTVQSYLTFPLQGPYRWDHAVAINHQQWDRDRELPLVFRGSSHQAERMIGRSQLGNSQEKWQIQSFGQVTVIDRLPSKSRHGS